MSPGDGPVRGNCDCGQFYAHAISCGLVLNPLIRAMPSTLPEGVSVSASADAVAIEIPGRQMLVLRVDEALAVCRALYLTAETQRRAANARQDNA